LPVTAVVWFAWCIVRPTLILHANRCPVVRCRRVSSLSDTELDALVAEAVVDCYDEHEQLSGLFVMIQDHLAVPFDTEVLGVPVVVRKVDLRSSGIVAICHRGRLRQAIGVLDLPLPDPAPDGAEWIEAYQWWAAGR
jgi:hypothetical protein